MAVYLILDVLLKHLLVVYRVVGKLKVPARISHVVIFLFVINRLSDSLDIGVAHIRLFGSCIILG